MRVFDENFNKNIFKELNCKNFDRRPWIPFGYLLPINIDVLYWILKKDNNIIELAKNCNFVTKTDFEATDNQIPLVYGSPIYFVPKKYVYEGGINVKRKYQTLVKAHGQDKVDIFITDDNTIKSNIKITIDDVFDSMQCDELVISYENIHDLNAADIMMGKMVSTPRLIYAVAKENYIIVSEREERNIKYLILKKK